MSSDSSQPDFWNQRYLDSETPWEFAGVPADLMAFLKRKEKPGPRTLIPGCGAGHEIKAFEIAHFDVTALDFAPEAVEQARRNAGPEFKGAILQADFFSADLAPGSFDLIYERTFLCALPPARRKDYVKRVATLLKPGGYLIGYFFYKKTDPAEGPPHGLAWGEGDELFSLHFLQTRDVAVKDSLPIFEGRERWQELRRTSRPA
jgi:SAM-dependent methyltransferase